jgi:CheY-like chemotaxis protein
VTTPAPRPRRVLVVDGHHDTAESYALLLGMLGHDTRLATTCAEALRAVDGFPADLVLLDVGLTGEDGYALAGLLRAVLPHRPRVVAVTGPADPEGRPEAAGFDGHLARPVSPEVLAALMDGLPGG